MKRLLNKIKSFFGAWFQLSYILLILVYSVLAFVRVVARRISIVGKLERPLERLMDILDTSPETSISRTELIDLAMQNMRSKKNRTLVTIGGMTVGIAGIVFLISIAYGLQALVVDRVARLEELRQAEVTTQPGSNLLINDSLIDSVGSYDKVDLVLPQIAVVGKVSFNNSATDMAVYGVTKDYLEQSAIAPVTGHAFENNALDTDIEAETEITEIDSSEATDEELTGEWVEVEGESDQDAKILVSKVVFPEEIKDRKAVVNRSFLKVLNLDEAEAVGQTFDVSFVATNRSLVKDQNRIESTTTTYEIVGVTPDDITPLFYVPFTHLKSLGIDSYSQIKVVVDDEGDLADVRAAIENQGYTTASVVDTVAQIDELFGTARLVLSLLGTVALFVAALGMFNTLTVSLLERTREVGLLKAMGMKSKEVKELFLAESMIMGTLGGLLGIFFGLMAGKVIEAGLSLYAVAKGAGSITIVDIPVFFALFIIVLSFLVGVFTGIYPARRATRISALNALRYE